MHGCRLDSASAAVEEGERADSMLGSLKRGDHVWYVETSGCFRARVVHPLRESKGGNVTQLVIDDPESPENGQVSLKTEAVIYTHCCCLHALSAAGEDGASHWREE